MSENKIENEVQLPTFTPVIKGSEVVALKINDRDFLMKKNVAVQVFFEELLPLFQKIDEFFDFNQITQLSTKKDAKNKWTMNELQKFWSDLSEVQKKIINIIYLEKKISRKNLILKLFDIQDIKENYGYNKKLAGISASITRKWNKINFAPIWNIKRNFYELNSDLTSLIKNILKKGEVH